MTDEIINSNSEDLVSSASSLIATITPTCTDGEPTPCDNDFQSDTESEKPVLLELGSTSNLTLTGTSIYPMDMHLGNSGSVYMSPHASQAYLNSSDSQSVASSLLASRIGMYGNPFEIRSAFPSHIPHTVCTWPASDVVAKVSSEIVPPPLYASYAGTRELSIVKETNPSWKEKALQIEKDYKKTACDRERTRMRDMNRAFDLLRSKLPISKPNGKKYSKIESLRIAINYIHHLQECLKSDSQEIARFTTATKAFSRSMTLEYPTDSKNHRQSQVYQLTGETNTNFDSIRKEQDKSHNGAWSESSYVPNSQDQWD